MDARGDGPHASRITLSRPVWAGLAWTLFIILGLISAAGEPGNIVKWVPPAIDFLVGPARLVTLLGGSAFLIPATAAACAWLVIVKKDWRAAVVLAVAMLGSDLLMHLFKDLWMVPRPVVPHLAPAGGMSYPSGHAMMSLLFFGYLSWYLAVIRQKKEGWLFLLVALLVGLSRPLLGVHYPADVLGGWAAAVGILALICDRRFLMRGISF